MRTRPIAAFLTSRSFVPGSVDRHGFSSNPQRLLTTHRSMKLITSERSSRGLEQDRSASRKVPLIELGPLANCAVCISAADVEHGGLGDLDIYTKDRREASNPPFGPQKTELAHSTGLRQTNGHNVSISKVNS